MSFNRLLSFAIAGVVVLFMVSCGGSSGDKYPNVVTVTKTTKFATAPDGSPLKDQVGVVKFSHDVHEKQGLKCVQCHHKQYNDDREKKCAPCHMGDEGYKKMHALCVDCHINKKKGPQQCYDCHAKLK
jgi:formate-dependent nitrite reductase cytochrome c552 subunit